MTNKGKVIIRYGSINYRNIYFIFDCIGVFIRLFAVEGGKIVYFIWVANFKISSILRITKNQSWLFDWLKIFLFFAQVF